MSEVHEWGIVHWRETDPEPIDLADLAGVELTQGDADRLLACIAGDPPRVGARLDLFKRQRPELWGKKRPIRVRYAVSSDNRVWTSATLKGARWALRAFPLARQAFALLEQGRKSIRFEAGPGWLDVEVL